MLDLRQTGAGSWDFGCLQESKAQKVCSGHGNGIKRVNDEITDVMMWMASKEELRRTPRLMDMIDYVDLFWDMHLRIE